MKKEFHAVLSFDCTSETLMNTLQTIVVENLRKMYAAALLAHGAVNDGSTKPDIHLYSDDFLMGKEDINVPTQPMASPEKASEAMQKEVAEHGGPKRAEPANAGSASFGDEEEDEA